MLTNPFGISYVDRSWKQIKDNILTKFQNNVPEITDHTESNIWVKGINIWAALIEMIGFYLDRRAQEVYITAVLKFESAIKIAALFDYRARGTIAATVDLKFFIDAATTADITIPQDTEVQTGDGVVFLTTEIGVLLTGQTEVTIPARQIQKVTGTVLGTSNGSVNQSFEMEDNVVDNSVNITAGTDVYTNQDTFAYSFATDQHFVAGLNESAKMAVKFGDNINGLVPTAGQTITANYSVSQGANGNVAALAITQVNSAVTVPSGVTLKVENILAAAGGSNQETTADLRKNIPLSIRTLNRMVTDQDYQDITELAPGVSRAAVDFACANDIEIYIVPDGGGIASAALLSSTESFVTPKKIVGRRLNLVAAGEVTIQFTIQLNVLDTFTRVDVVQAVKDAITSFLSVDNQEIGGTVQLSDIYQQIESVSGVNNSTIEIMTTIPFARGTNTTTVLDWTREVQSASESTVRWEITFTNATNFELKKDGSFIGNFPVGAQITQDEIVFTVNTGSYATGDSYEFYSYRYNGTVNLQERSIPVSDDTNITINAFGGVT